MKLTFDNAYARLAAGIFHAPTAPEPLRAPYLVSVNPEIAALLGIDAADPDLVPSFAGTKPIPGAQPVAMAYAGHQFGVYVPQLGDGRALLLGEAVVGEAVGTGADGTSRWDLHAKGSGRTPYSRGFDGRAVLRSTIREYLGGEAMHGLGIPTTRALCVIGTDEPVLRERPEPGALLVRVAPSAGHVRFGTFELHANRGQHERVRELADFVMARAFPALPRGDHAALLGEVVLRTARLMADWQAVGFTHGVMNSDNMSILGLTLDYGPYAFLDDYDPAHAPNHSDETGRYAHARQPVIALWNLGCLAHALLPLVGEPAARAALDRYGPSYVEHHETRMQRKLGLTTWRGEEDAALLATLLRTLHQHAVDWTRFWRALGRFVPGVPASQEPVRSLFVDPAAFDDWSAVYGARLDAEANTDHAARRAAMDRVNPKYILRTHLAQRAIARAEQKDFSEVDRLLAILRDPYAEQPVHEAYADLPAADERDYSLSCSS